MPDNTLVCVYNVKCIKCLCKNKVMQYCTIVLFVDLGAILGHYCIITCVHTIMSCIMVHVCEPK